MYPIYPYIYAPRPLAVDFVPQAITGTSKVVAQPSLEPITLDELKTHVRITWTDEDSILSAYVQAARERLEDILDRSFVVRDMLFTFSDITSNTIYLPRGPIQEITSFKTINPDGTETVHDPSEYTLVLDKDPAEIILSGLAIRYHHYDWHWRDTTYYQIQYKAGYADTEVASVAATPAPIKNKLLELATLMYEQRKLDLTVPIGNLDDVMQYRSVRPA